MSIYVILQLILDSVNPAVVFKYSGSEGESKCFVHIYVLLLTIVIDLNLTAISLSRRILVTYLKAENVTDQTVCICSILQLFAYFVSAS